MGIGRRLYNHVPVPLQNAAISLYGLRLRYLRYGGVFSEQLKLAKEHLYYDKDRIGELVTQNLRSFAHAAISQTPWYQSHVDISARQIELLTVDNFSDYFPVLEKQAVRDDQEMFRSRVYRPSELITINTSGTTGSPLKISVTRKALQTNYAYFTRFLESSGIPGRSRGATFAGRVFIPARQLSPPYWRYNIFNRNMMLSTYHLSDASMPYYIHALEEWKPDYIDSYPSAIFQVAKFINEHRVPHAIRPKAVITSSETLMPSQRAEIELAFGCKVFDHYGCAEMAALITQCSKGRYHINTDFGIVELLDSNNRPVRPGEAGDLVCTGFINDAMPLIRYKVGDSAIASSSDCDCGSWMPVIGSIVGRNDDLIITRDGRKIGRLDPVFKSISGIRETQIIQLDLARIKLLIVKGDDFSDNSLSSLIGEIKARVGNDFVITVEFIDNIPRGANGKFRSVVSMINRNITHSDG